MSDLFSSECIKAIANSPQMLSVQIRDWFAGMAAVSSARTSLPDLDPGEADAIAKRAYQIADALIKARQL